MKKYGVLCILLNLFFTLPADALTVYKYRIYCITEGKNTYEWSQVAPTTCPNNTAHTINPHSISIVGQVATNEVKVQQESVPTGGNFKAETFKLYAATGPAVSSMQISWPFPISLLQAGFTTDITNQGDTITVEIPSNLPIGEITKNVNQGDTVINVSDAVIQNSMIGYYIILNDGNNSDDLGRIVAIDSVNNILTIENTSAHSYAVTTPTIVGLTVSPISDFEFGPPQTYTLGQSSLGASSIPANMPVVIKYQNNGNAEKSIVFAYEYLY